MVYRSYGDNRRAANARTAASTARWTCSRLAQTTSARFLPVNLSSTGSVAGPTTGSPSIKRGSVATAVVSELREVLGRIDPGLDDERSRPVPSAVEQPRELRRLLRARAVAPHGFGHLDQIGRVESCAPTGIFQRHLLQL